MNKYTQLFSLKFLNSRFGVMLATTFLTLIWFVIDWCLATTFRSMSLWILWVNNILAALLLLLPYMLSRKIWIQIIWLLIADMFMLANIMYCRTYFTAIPAESYLLASNLSDFTASIWYSLRYQDLMFPAILIAGGIIAYRFPKESPKTLWPQYITLTALFAIVSGVGIAAGGGLYKAYDKLAYGSKCGVPAYTIFGHLYFVKIDNEKARDQKMLGEISEWLALHEDLMPRQFLPDSITPRKNLIIILLESFESWPINKSVQGKEITPYINSLLADPTTLFAPKMLTQVDAGRSIDAQLLLTAGLLPPQETVYSTHYPSNTYPTLNKALKEKYHSRSMIMSVDNLNVWNFGEIAKAFGYDSILGKDTWKIDEKVGQAHKLSDGSFFRQAASLLDREWEYGKPAMITLVTYSGHHPFLLPDELADPEFDTESMNLYPTLKRYLRVVHYTDSKLKTIVEYIKSRPDSDDTMIVISGDHEGLATERKSIRDSSPLAAELVDSYPFTPFIVLNSPIAGNYDEVMGQIDMFPTILTLMGVSDYHWPGLGQNILAPDKIPAAISSMTKELVGDTIGIYGRKTDHFMNARRISDGIIRSDYLKR